LSDRAFSGADTWATSLTLGKALEKIGDYDLIICGRQAIDGDTAQIGPQVADHLSIPHVSYVFGIDEISEERLVVRRRLEDGFERIETSVPALLTVIGELNTPRYAMVGRLIEACGEKASIEVWNAADIGCQTREIGLEGSLTHVIKTFAPKFKRQGEMLEGASGESISALLGKLHENRII
jgi:electron transfer flavoprotein alpha/beta subunit